jgi:hypothetical protein
MATLTAVAYMVIQRSFSFRSHSLVRGPRGCWSIREPSRACRRRDHLLRVSTLPLLRLGNSFVDFAPEGRLARWSFASAPLPTLAIAFCFLRLVSACTRPYATTRYLLIRLPFGAHLNLIACAKGIEPRFYKLLPERDWEVDLHDLRSKATPKTKYACCMFARQLCC